MNGIESSKYLWRSVDEAFQLLMKKIYLQQRLPKERDLLLLKRLLEETLFHDLDGCVLKEDAPSTPLPSTDSEGATHGALALALSKLPVPDLTVREVQGRGFAYTEAEDRFILQVRKLYQQAGEDDGAAFQYLSSSLGRPASGIANRWATKLRGKAFPPLPSLGVSVSTGRADPVVAEESDHSGLDESDDSDDSDDSRRRSRSRGRRHRRAPGRTAPSLIPGNLPLSYTTEEEELIQRTYEQYRRTGRTLDGCCAYLAARLGRTSQAVMHKIKALRATLGLPHFRPASASVRRRDAREDTGSESDGASDASSVQSASHAGSDHSDDSDEDSLHNTDSSPESHTRKRKRAVAAPASRRTAVSAPARVTAPGPLGTSRTNLPRTPEHQRRPIPTKSPRREVTIEDAPYTAAEAALITRTYELYRMSGRTLVECITHLAESLDRTYASVASKIEDLKRTLRGKKTGAAPSVGVVSSAKSNGARSSPDRASKSSRTELSSDSRERPTAANGGPRSAILASEPYQQQAQHRLLQAATLKPKGRPATPVSAHRTPRGSGTPRNPSDRPATRPAPDSPAAVRNASSSGTQGTPGRQRRNFTEEEDELLMRAIGKLPEGADAKQYRKMAARLGVQLSRLPGVVAKRVEMLMAAEGNVRSHVRAREPAQQPASSRAQTVPTVNYNAGSFTPEEDSIIWDTYAQHRTEASSSSAAAATGTGGVLGFVSELAELLGRSYTQVQRRLDRLRAQDQAMPR